jgi:hypothetical protein
MSIGIAIAVPDGIALAADTQTTWSNIIAKAKDKKTGQDFDLAEPISMPVGWSQMARKLFSVSITGKTYAIVTAGESTLNHTTRYAIFRSGAHKYDGTGKYDDVLQYYINYLKAELSAHFSCTSEQLSNQTRKVCEFILTGYEEDDVAKPAVESHLVFSGKINIDGKPDSSGHFRKSSNRTQTSRYGGCWIGQIAFISHVVNHSNKDLPPISGQYEMMTLADATDYTQFLVSFTCDFQRFAIMVPNCGRPILSAALTPDSYEEKTIK